MAYFEIRRKLFHVLGGILLLTGILTGVLTKWLLVLLIGLLLLASWFIQHYPHNVFMQILRLFERKKNLEHFPLKGMVFFFVGCTLPLFFFPFPIAIASIIILTVGDATSALIGKYFGTIAHPFSTTKKIEGHIVGGLFAFLASWWGTQALGLAVAPWHLFLASVVTLFLEGIEHPWHHTWLDDNMMIPLVSGLILVLLKP